MLQSHMQFGRGSMRSRRIFQLIGPAAGRWYLNRLAIARFSDGICQMTSGRRTIPVWVITITWVGRSRPTYNTNVLISFTMLENPAAEQPAPTPPSTEQPAPPSAAEQPVPPPPVEKDESSVVITAEQAEPIANFFLNTSVLLWSDHQG